MTLGNGVNQWLGLRFAAPSVPPLRFAAPQPPLSETETQDATQEGALCVSANNQEGLQFDSPRQPMAEDCLFAAVYAPANATETSMLPIMMFISGGGFTSNSNGNFNGTGLVEASGMNMIVVRANYRVGILGFVGGTLIDNDPNGAVPNNGLHDMVAAARWVQQFATKFGGNPDHIVVNGASSGGNAIDLLLTANNGVGFPDLFKAAIAESTGWGAEGYSVDRDQALANNLASTGCNATADPIDCLRNMPIAELQNRTTTDGWGPTLDGTFLVAPHYQMYEQGRFQNLPVLYGYASDEATPSFIANQTVNTTEEVAADIRQAVGASLTDDEVAQLLAAYPASLNNVSLFGRDVAPRAGASARHRQGAGASWQRDAAIRTELQLHCVGAFFSDAFATVGQTANYAYRYDVLDETPGGNAEQGLFSPHTSELYAVWGANNTDGGDPGCLTLAPAESSSSLSCAVGAQTTQAYWISFVRTGGDPNAFRRPGAPAWTPWTVAAPNRLVLGNTAAAMEQMGAAVGEVALQGMNQRQRCLLLMNGFAKRMNLGLGAGEVLPAFANGTREDGALAVVLAQQQQQQQEGTGTGPDGSSLEGAITNATKNGGTTTVIVVEGANASTVAAAAPLANGTDRGSINNGTGLVSSNGTRPGVTVSGAMQLAASGMMGLTTVVVLMMTGLGTLLTA